MNLKNTVFVLVTMMSMVYVANTYSSPFLKNKYNVSIKANRIDLEYVKLKAEYRTLKKAQFCKGAFIAYSNEDWVCDQGSTQKCTKKYKCKRVNRNFNLKTESKRIRKAMAQTGMVRPGKHKIWVSRKPVRQKAPQQKVAKSLSPKSFSGVQYLGTGPIKGQLYGATPEERAAYEAKKKKEAAELKEKMAKEEALKELREEKKKQVAEKIAAKGFKKAKRVADVRKEEALDELDDIDDSEFQEAMDISEDSTESDLELDFTEEESEAVASVDDDNNTSDAPADDGSLFQLLAFSGGFVNINTTEQSLSTLEVAWTPRIKFGSGSTFGIRGHYGFHQYTLPETALTTEEVLVITDMKAMLYKYFGNFVIEVGAGVQSWGGSVGESFSTTSGTLGYKFDNYILKAVDRIYVHYMQIASEEPTTSIEFGIGISF